MMRRVVVLLLLLAPMQAWAVQPDEMLKDPVLEARARSLSEELRCLICQSQSIDESDATIARDLRLLIRDRLTKGDSDAAVKEFLVDRYGYLRARWIPEADGPGWNDSDMLLQQLTQLNREKEILPPPGDHVH